MKSIGEKNIMLAVYSGHVFHAKTDTANEGIEFVNDEPNRSFFIKTGDLKYHFDFNWLMEVVERIEEERFEDGERITLTTFYQNMVRFKRFPLRSSDKMVTTLFDAVIDVVEYLNERAKKINRVCECTHKQACRKCGESKGVDWALIEKR